MPCLEWKTISREQTDALVFDLDGVVTRTAGLHAEAWKRMFDGFLREREGEGFRPFDIGTDYRRYVDGRPRYDGVGNFLESRGIDLPYGTPEDPPERVTVCGLGNRKNRLFSELLRRKGVVTYPGAVALIHAARGKGFLTAVVTASRNGANVVKSAGLAEAFDVMVDGVETARLGLRGKPAPDTYLEACRRLGVEPARAVMFEDASAGVEAGRQGGFGCVVGVDRDGSGDLRTAGADVVVEDLEGVTVAGLADTPSALERFDAVTRFLGGRRPFVCLDYDGTLTPIVERPERADLSAGMRDTVERLAGLCPVAVISGRDRTDVASKVGAAGVFYAGSHGFDIEGPGGVRAEVEGSDRFPARLDHAERLLRQQVSSLPGVRMERKRFALAVHYRGAADSDVERILRIVSEQADRGSGLRRVKGKKVIELRPDIAWDKGAAVHWLMNALETDPHRHPPIYIGDDTTDEDAFRAIAGEGIAVLVSDEVRPTAARYRLREPGEVERFLERLVVAVESG